MSGANGFRMMLKASLARCSVAFPYFHAKEETVQLESIRQALLLEERQSAAGEIEKAIECLKDPFDGGAKAIGFIYAALDWLDSVESDGTDDSKWI